MTFTDEELRHHDRPHRFRCLRRGDDIFAVHALVTLGDGEPLALEVKIRWRERKHLAQAETTPVEQLEGDERLRLVHKLAAEAQVFVLRPEAHLVGLLASDLVDLRHGV